MSNEGSEGEVTARMAMPPHTPPRPRAPGAPRPPQHARGWSLMALARIPVAVVEKGVILIGKVLGLGASIIVFIGQQVLPTPLLQMLRSGVQAVMTHGEEIDPQLAARNFIQEFSDEFGSVRPNWVECSWEDAAALAHSQFKFLFVYLHSPQHQDTAKFCRDTLCHPEVVDYLNTTFVCWGGNIRYSNAFRLSNSLRVAKYPYGALLVFSGARTRLVCALEGRLTPAVLLEGLHRAVDDHSIQLSVEQADHNERDMNRRLREEQDAEYQRSLEADRQRERVREEARNQKEAAARAAAEAAARAQAEKEAEAKRAADYAEALAARKTLKRASLAPEPPVGAPGTTHIRLRLPDGTVQQRRFESKAPLQLVFDFVDSLEQHSALRYVLATSFPKTILGGAALERSLADLGLAPQAMLLVQPLDDD